MYLPTDETSILYSGQQANITPEQLDSNISKYSRENQDIGFTEAFTDSLDYAIALSRSDSEENIWMERLNDQSRLISELTGESDLGVSDRLFKAYAGVRGDLITPDDLLGDKELEDREKRIWQLKEQFPDRAAELKTQADLQREIASDMQDLEKYYEQSGARVRGFVPNAGRFLGLAAGTLTDMPNVLATVGGIGLSVVAPPVAGGAVAAMASRATLEFALNTAAEGIYQAKNIQPYRSRVGLESGFTRGATEALTAGVAAGGLSAAGEIGILGAKSLLKKFRSTIVDPTPAEALSELHLSAKQSVEDKNPISPVAGDEVGAILKNKQYADQTLDAVATGDYSKLPNLSEENFSDAAMKDGMTVDEYIAYIKEGEAFKQEQVKTVSDQIDITTKELPNSVDRYFNDLRSQFATEQAVSARALTASEQTVKTPDVSAQIVPEAIVPAEILPDLNVKGKVVNALDALDIQKATDLSGEKLLASARKSAAILDQKIAKISDAVSGKVEPAQVASKAERIGKVASKKIITVPNQEALTQTIKQIDKQFDIVGHVNKKDSWTAIIKNKDGTTSSVEINMPKAQEEIRFDDPNYIPTGFKEAIDPLTGNKIIAPEMQSLSDIIREIDIDEATIKSMTECKI